MPRSQCDHKRAVQLPDWYLKGFGEIYLDSAGFKAWACMDCPKQWAEFTNLWGKVDTSPLMPLSEADRPTGLHYLHAEVRKLEKLWHPPAGPSFRKAGSTVILDWDESFQDIGRKMAEELDRAILGFLDPKP